MTDLTRPIIGIENRTAQEVFDIMCDRFRTLSTITPAEVGGLVGARETLNRIADEQPEITLEDGAYVVTESVAIRAMEDFASRAFSDIETLRTALAAERAAHAETKRERDEAIKAVGDQATLRGKAEGKLAVSEMAGIVDGWKRRSEAAEAQRDEALKALEPFAQHLDEMKFDLDNRGNPLPDDQAVGWVYVTIGDFRNARRALGGKKDV